MKAKTTNRKAIGNKLRFEVFKRDSFTCQYCGHKSPDVLLEVDHIKPVANGGTNTILNLITSCKECNSGKSKNELSDQSVIEKQRKQLEELEERRQQLEMLMKWQHGLHDHSNLELEKFMDYYNTVNECNRSLTETGKVNMKKLIKKFGFQDLLKAVDIVASKYSSLDPGDRFGKLGGVLNYMNASEDERNVMYIKGVCRNRFAYFNPISGTELIRDVLADYKYEYVLDIAKTARNWSQWKTIMYSLLEPQDAQS